MCLVSLLLFPSLYLVSYFRLHYEKGASNDYIYLCFQVIVIVIKSVTNVFTVTLTFFIICVIKYYATELMAF